MSTAFERNFIRALKEVFKYCKNRYRHTGEGGGEGDDDGGGSGGDDDGGGGGGDDGGPPGGNGGDGAFTGGDANVGVIAENKPVGSASEIRRKIALPELSSKVVLVIGFGNGILPIFCAQATEARLVYIVDSRSTAIDQACQVIEDHNLIGKFCLLHGEVEELQMCELADVIISEWMGNMLFYKSMLETFITARERWLKPGGLIFPSYATLYMAPVTYPQRFSDTALHLLCEIDSLNKGNSLSSFLRSLTLESTARRFALGKPYMEIISGECVLSQPHVVSCIDCSTVKFDEVEIIVSRFNFVSMKEAPFNGFAFWFDVEYGSPPIHSLMLSTAPGKPPTHWKQMMVYSYPLVVKQDQVIEGFVKLTQNRENATFMKIHLAYTCAGQSYVQEAFMR